MKNFLGLLMIGLLLVTSGCGRKDRGRVTEPKHIHAHLLMEQTEWNFGLLTDANGTVEHEFTIINDGNEPLAIANIQAYCSCTEVEYDKAPIRPGHAIKLKVRLNTHDLSPGHFTRTIEVYTDGNRGRATIFLRGEKQ